MCVWTRIWQYPYLLCISSSAPISVPNMPKNTTRVGPCKQSEDKALLSLGGHGLEVEGLRSQCGP